MAALPELKSRAFTTEADDGAMPDQFLVAQLSKTCLTSFTDSATSGVLVASMSPVRTALAQDLMVTVSAVPLEPSGA